MPFESITDLDNQQELSEDPKYYTSNPEDLEIAKSINRILRLRAPKETAGFVGRLDLRPHLGLQMGSDDFYSTNLRKVSDINIDKATDPHKPKMIFSFKDNIDAKSFCEEFTGYKTIEGNPILSNVDLNGNNVKIPTKENFEQIRNSTAAREFRAKQAEERVYKIKDEPLKRAAAAVMNWPTLGIPVVPMALGVAGIILGNCDNLCRATGIFGPLSPFFSWPAQVCLKTAAMGMDRGNFFASKGKEGEESRGRKIANYFNKIEKEIQEDEEKEVRSAPWKSAGNVALAAITAIPSYVANGVSIIFNGAGDFLLNSSRKCLDYIQKKDEKNNGSSELNLLTNFSKASAMTGLAFLLSIAGNTFRAVGQTTRAVGQALSLPSEYLHPKSNPEESFQYHERWPKSLKLGIIAHDFNDLINRKRLDAAQFGAKRDENDALIKDEKGNLTYVTDLNPFAKGDNTKVAPDMDLIDLQNKKATKEESNDKATNKELATKLKKSNSNELKDPMTEKRWNDELKLPKTHAERAKGRRGQNNVTVR